VASSVVHQAEVQGGAAHALIIGVGDYPHLKGGAGTLFSGHENMGQLDCAPVSARQFAEWLIRTGQERDPLRPLASVRMLLSEKKGFFGGATKFDNPVSGESHVVPTATLAEVTSAIVEWKNALDANEGDLGIFFFSGHGVMVGLEQILLLADFGDSAAAKTRGSAIRFNPFRAAMARIKARQQCYFIDACRAYTQAFASAQGVNGESFIDPDPSIQFGSFAAQPVFNATVEGESAFGRPGEPSLFTDALLQALKGGGTDNRYPPYDWRIEVGHLNDAIEFLVRRRAEREGLGLLQIPSAQELLPVQLGKISGAPLVPVGLRCAPGEATAAGQFICPDQAQWKSGQPDPLIPMGTHKFEVTFSDSRYTAGSFEMEIRPPCRIVEVPVALGGP